MRYYKLVISDPKTGEILIPNYNGTPGFTRVAFSPLLASYSTLYSGGSVLTLGSTNANAMRVEFDVPVAFMHEPMANSYVRISGVSIAEAAQAAGLARMNVALFGGMAKGLPLANPAQIGPLFEGQVFQSFANWTGLVQDLNLYVAAGGSSPLANQTTGNPAGTNTPPAVATNDKSAYITFQWQPGQPLMTPLLQTLRNIYPQYKIVGNVSPSLVWTGTAETAFFTKLSQFAEYVNRTSINLIGGYAPDLTQYQGVMLSLQNNTITVQDGTTQTTPKQILFTDLIGQPTASKPLVITAICVLRGDIKVGDYVSLPASLLNVSASAQTGLIPLPTTGSVNTQTKNGSILTGSYLVTGVRHVGDSRDPQGTSWITVLDLLVTAPSVASRQVSAFPVVAKPSPVTFHLP